MVTMGFPKDEITESLQGQKYDDVMATYLLLGRKAPEVNLCHCDIIIKYTIALVAHSEFLLTFFFFFGFQFEGSEPLTNSVLGQRQRPTSDINNGSSVSPAHPKVTRSISANQKQRRYSDHGGDDDGGGGVVEKPSKVTSSFPALRRLRVV